MIRGSIEWYANLWDTMVILPQFEQEVDKALIKILSNKSKYETVAKITTVPWFFTALLHWRESRCDFAAILHNGERIIGVNKKTKLVPKGRGPFESWEEAAIDALKIQKLDKNMDWSISNMLALFEKYNGTGYLRYHPEQNSPYLWSYTNHVQPKGRYRSDGKYDHEALANEYAGVAPLMHCILME